MWTAAPRVCARTCHSRRAIPRLISGAVRKHERATAGAAQSAGLSPDRDGEGAILFHLALRRVRRAGPTEDHFGRFTPPPIKRRRSGRNSCRNIGTAVPSHCGFPSPTCRQTGQHGIVSATPFGGSRMRILAERCLVVANCKISSLSDGSLIHRKHST
jgi:hypothetical protein